MAFHVKISGRANFLGISCIMKCRYKCIESYTVSFGKSSGIIMRRKKYLSVTHTFSLGCGSVIEYSRSLIWPRSIFFI